MRRAFISVAVLGMVLAALASATAQEQDAGDREAQEQEAPRGALVIGLPLEEARLLVDRRPAAVGLGVYPPSRDARAFLAAFARGDDLEGGGLLEPARADELSVAAGVAARASDDTIAFLAEVVAPDGGTVPAALAADVGVVVLRLADEADAVLRLTDRPTFVLGTEGRTPLLVAMLNVPSDGLLAGGVARRTGIVTPADLARTILDAAGVAAGPPGELLRIEPAARPLEPLDELAARLEADASFPGPLTKATVGIGLFAVGLGTAALVLRQRRFARALAVGVLTLPAGYVAALFLAGRGWLVRAPLVAGAFVVGGLLSRAGARRTAGWIALLTTVALAGLTLVAEAAPDGPVARGLWGDPLVSWRFFGLRNHLAAFLAGGFLSAAVLLALPAWLLIGGGAAIGFVIAAPTLGANFVAVMTLGIAVTLVVLARAAGRPRMMHLPYAAVAGIAAIAAALLADAGTPVSHGGRAVRSIGEGGVDALWDIVTRRARLNVDEITAFGVYGVIAFALAAFALALMFWWSLRAADAEVSLRAGVGGLAAAALVALVVEDSGFFVGGILGLFPWALFVIERAEAVSLPPATAPPPAPADPSPPDPAGTRTA